MVKEKPKYAMYFILTLVGSVGTGELIKYLINGNTAEFLTGLLLIVGVVAIFLFIVAPRIINNFNQNNQNESQTTNEE
jgi:predicted PurR-regulated permease PerM